MIMDSRSIQIADSELSEIKLTEQTLVLKFCRLYIIETMTGAKERVLWWQKGELIVGQAHLVQPLPTTPPPYICTTGDIDDNIYTYRDMIPIPLNTKGQIRCQLQFQNHTELLCVRAGTLTLVLHDQPHYLRHMS
jgi:hypothetical protein